jgi:hypothetical protein
VRLLGRDVRYLSAIVTNLVFLSNKAIRTSGCLSSVTGVRCMQSTGVSTGASRWDEMARSFNNNNAINIILDSDKGDTENLFASSYNPAWMRSTNSSCNNHGAQQRRAVKGRGTTTGNLRANTTPSCWSATSGENEILCILFFSTLCMLQRAVIKDL